MAKLDLDVSDRTFRDVAIGLLVVASKAIWKFLWKRIKLSWTWYQLNKDKEVEIRMKWKHIIALVTIFVIGNALVVFSATLFYLNVILGRG